MSLFLQIVSINFKWNEYCMKHDKFPQSPNISPKFSSTGSSFFSTTTGASFLASVFPAVGAGLAGPAVKAPNCLTLMSASKLIAAMFLNPLRRICGTESSLISPTTKDKAAKLLQPFLNLARISSGDILKTSGVKMLPSS